MLEPIKELLGSICFESTFLGQKFEPRWIKNWMISMYIVMH